MSTSTNRKHIVIGFDQSELSELALREAVNVSVHAASVYSFHVVTVVEDADVAGQRQIPVMSRIKNQIERVLRPLTLPFDLELHCHVLPGDPASVILAIADDVEADLIIVGTHGRRGLRRLLVGSCAERLVREASCPVTVVRARHYDPHPELVPEPACPTCVAIRASGAADWCTDHSRPYSAPHRYTYRDGGLHPVHSDGLGPT